MHIILCYTKLLKTLCTLLRYTDIHPSSYSVNFNSISVANCSIHNELLWNSSSFYHCRCLVRKLRAWYGSWKTPHSAGKTCRLHRKRKKLGQLRVASKPFWWKHLSTYSLSVMIKCNNCIDCHHSTSAISSVVSSIIHSQNREALEEPHTLKGDKE